MGLMRSLGAAVLAGALCWTAPVAAQTASGEDTFRRVTPPPPGHSGPRITIQIRPGDNFTTPAAPALGAAAAPAASGPRTGARPPQGSDMSWFWDAVSPSLPADPARYWSAQDVMARAPEAGSVPAPRLHDLAFLAERYGRLLLAESVGTHVSPALALAVIAVESGGHADATSPAGAQGLMQLIPDTAERFDVTDPFEPAQNIAGGIAYLDWLMGRFGRDPVLVLAAYNAGEGAVERAGGVPEYAETRAYVPRVLAAWQVARALCRTPPDLVSDGCVFRPIAVE